MELLDRIGLIMVICAMIVTVKKDANYLVKTQRKSRDSHEIAKDEPQTCEECEHWSDTEDGCADRHGCKTEPQTDCAWAKPLPEFNCKECKWWSPITKTCHYDGFPCKYEPIPII